MHAVVVNSTVDGVLAAVFAILIIIVIGNALVVWYRALTSTTPLPTSEVPAEPSQLVAPAGLFATAEEKRAMATAGDRS
jgi:carbon starvation protein